MPFQFLFFDDYSEGAHPEVLAQLAASSTQQDRTYGADAFTDQAKRLIRDKTRQPNASIHFVASGTQANIVCLAALLKPFESVVAEHNGHINVHETGAIEATGHKINCVAGINGKLTCAGIQSVLDTHSDEQMVRPGAVYISQPTELGTIYSKSELEQLFQFCRSKHLYLHIDGARLGHALASHEADFALHDIAANCDIFYIGGTKNGGLIGEAIVIVNPLLQPDFAYHLRQRGALLSKARSVSVQFTAMFRDNLYFDSARHANRLAVMLGEGLNQLGIEFLHATSTNQLFPILPDELITSLKPRYGFHVWCKAQKPGHSVIRLVTSWSTPEAAIHEFLESVGAQLSV